MTDQCKTGLLMIAMGLITFASMVLTTVPDIEESNGEALDFYAGATGPTKTFFAFYLCVAAVVLVFTWVSQLRRRIEDAGGRFPSSVPMATAGYGALALAGGASFLLPTAYTHLGFNTKGGEIEPLFMRTASAMGDAFALLAAPVLLGLTVAGVCWASRPTNALGRGIRGSGYIVGGLLLAGWTWFPTLLFVLWSVVAGIFVVARAPRRPSDQAGAATDGLRTSVSVGQVEAPGR
ncbi:hypothetical protein N802_13875 [Knoellia sinensis KCTC 19936]|uniref:DUF4386 family protein n=1 Tax=Knoellia sinensis KCTC 19936 TaxID=1385520 RepID=A0A0A0JCM7_9MICO|nr:hypothetical protein [Knoellia sinensis]KGN33396.1 hypothetical protein N802_13875 [Knoellia sinensis KCTC 19936]